VVKQRPPTVFLTDWYSLFFENEEARLAYQRLTFDARAAATIARALYILSLGRVVITDRLHGHIFCLLLGIPHVLLNNDSGKNWNFYETWTRDSPLCRLARNPRKPGLWPVSRCPNSGKGTAAHGLGRASPQRSLSRRLPEISPI